MVIRIILCSIASLFVLFLLFYQFIFLRDPKRRVPSGNNIVAPADGKVIKIIRLSELDRIKVRKGLVGRIKTLVPANCKDGYLITIMMSLFDVHVQRSPLDGIVLGTKHISGKFGNAVYGDRFGNGIENEKNEIMIKNKKIGEIKVIQIAGFLARRIECFVKENQKINKGDILGRIVIGSQVSLILPNNINLLVKLRDKVKAGETILGEY